LVEISAGFFFVVLSFIAVMTWCKVKGKREYASVRTEEYKEEKEGLPVY